MFGRSKRKRAIKVLSDEELQELASSGKPVLVDFMQFGCAPCQVMEGIVDELADEFQDEAHVVKVNVARCAPELIQTFKVRSTPTFVVLAKQKSKSGGGRATARWRATGLVKKDALSGVLVRNGAARP